MIRGVREAKKRIRGMNRSKLETCSGVFGGIGTCLAVLWDLAVRGEKYCVLKNFAEPPGICHIPGETGVSVAYGAIGAFQFAPNA